MKRMLTLFLVSAVALAALTGVAWADAIALTPGEAALHQLADWWPWLLVIGVAAVTVILIFRYRKRK